MIQLQNFSFERFILVHYVDPDRVVVNHHRHLPNFLAVLEKHVLDVVLDFRVSADGVGWQIVNWLLLDKVSHRGGLLDGDLTRLTRLHLGGVVDDLASVLGPRRHHSAARMVLPPLRLTRLTGHHDLLGRPCVPLLTPGVLDMLLLVSLLDDALVLEPDLALTHHRPLDLARPHLHVSDVGLRLDRALGPQEDGAHWDPGLVTSWPWLYPVPHCLLHPRLARPRPHLARPDDVVSLTSPRVLATDDEGPGLATARVDHLRHLDLLLGLRLRPDHLDAPGGAWSDHHLAPARCLLPHRGPLSDLTSLRPRPLLHRARGHVILRLGPRLTLGHHLRLGRGRTVRLGVRRRHDLGPAPRPHRLTADHLLRVGTCHAVLLGRMLWLLLLVIVVVLLRMRWLRRVLLDLMVLGRLLWVLADIVLLIMLVVVGVVVHVMGVLLLRL